MKKKPTLTWQLFTIGVFALSMAVTLFTVAAQYTRLVFIPLSLETIRGYTALRVGLILTPAALLTAIGMSIGMHSQRTFCEPSRAGASRIDRPCTSGTAGPSSKRTRPLPALKSTARTLA